MPDKNPPKKTTTPQKTTPQKTTPQKTTPQKTTPQKTTTAAQGSSSKTPPVSRPTSRGTTTAGGPPPPPPPPAPAPKPAPKPVKETLTSGQTLIKDAAGYHHVWLCCYAGGLFKGHWVMFIESPTTPNSGTIIHAKGDPKTGFEQEFQRVSRQPWKSDRRPGYYDLGLILKSWVQPEGPYTTGRTTADVTPYNKLEQLALMVKAPGPSLRSATDAATKQRLTQENCQTYIKNLVATLMAQKPEGGHPVFIISREDVLELAPKQ